MQQITQLMKKFIYIALIICSILSSHLTQAQVTPYISSRLQYTLDSVCNKYQIKGTTAAVLIPGMGVWKGVNGNSKAGTPITTDMLMGMGSNTKTFIAAVLLKMQEQQLLSLDDSIGKWITGYANISGQITIRQCLNHTSGLHDYMQNAAINDSIFDKSAKIWTREEILRMAQAPNAVPGSNWDYSNTNYIIAGIIIEKVLNKSPFVAIQELINASANFNNTFNYGDEGAKTKANPWSMAMNGNTLVDMTTTPYLNNLFSLANTAGALITTAEDNVQFWYKLWNKEIINAQSWKEMTQLKSIGSNDGYGLGIFMYSRKMNGRTFFSHGGTFFGYINENMVDTTSGVTIAVLTNQDSMSNNGLLALVLRSLHKVTLNMPPVGLTESDYQSTKVTLYPNPANNKITIESSLNHSSITFTDITGRVVLTEKINDNKCSLSMLSQGTYIAYVKNQVNEIIHIQKIQVMR